MKLKNNNIWKTSNYNGTAFILIYKIGIEKIRLNRNDNIINVKNIIKFNLLAIF